MSCGKFLGVLRTPKVSNDVRYIKETDLPTESNIEIEESNWHCCEAENTLCLDCRNRMKNEVEELLSELNDLYKSKRNFLIDSGEKYDESVNRWLGAGYYNPIHVYSNGRIFRRPKKTGESKEYVYYKMYLYEYESKWIVFRFVKNNVRINEIKDRLKDCSQNLNNTQEENGKRMR